MAEIRGLPLLSGPPPPVDPTQACRKCNKEFNVFLNRSRKCNHCGYSYCHNCSDYQALMPRGGQEAGYGSMNVCAFCIEYLTITASAKGQLRTVPLSKLRKYVDAYDIKTHRAVEKDDLVEEILAARTVYGCLPKENENYYRKHSVPNRAAGPHHRSFFSRNSQTPPIPPPPPRPAARPQSHSFPRPDLAPDSQPEQQYHHQYPPHPSHQTHNHTPQPPPPPVPPRPPQPYNFQPPPMPRPQNPQAHPPPLPHDSRPYPPPPSSPPRNSRPYPPHHPPRPASSQAFNPPTPPHPRPRTASTAPPPSLDQLLDMPDSALAVLSISALKAILFTNHVNAGLILEKGDLVSKVRTLVEDERRERERQRALEEAEEAERIERQRALLEEHNREMRAREERAAAERDEWQGIEADERETREEGERAAPRNSGASSTSTSSPPRAPPVRGTATTLERTGLCVICQDDEANIAIVDCGHLAMCRDCSELVMKSSRECPLCRTRIVTEARLLRIFKT